MGDGVEILPDVRDVRRYDGYQPSQRPAQLGEANNPNALGGINANNGSGSGKSETQLGKLEVDPDSTATSSKDSLLDNGQNPFENENVKLVVSIVVIDSYDGKRFNEGPIIRVFGRTMTKALPVCVHIKNCFPYLFVKVPEKRMESIDTLQKMLRACINSHFKQNLIHRIVLCRGVDIYGYREFPERYFKIELLKAKMAAKVGDFLQSGQHRFEVRFQPYETHIPYLLQFLSDYELAGMGFMGLRQFTQVSSVDRHTDPDGPILEVEANTWDIVVRERGKVVFQDQTEEKFVPSLRDWLEEVHELLRDQDSFFMSQDEYEEQKNPPGVSHSYSASSDRPTPSGNCSAKEQLLKAWLASSQYDEDEEPQEQTEKRTNPPHEVEQHPAVDALPPPLIKTDNSNNNKEDDYSDNSSDEEGEKGDGDEDHVIWEMTQNDWARGVESKISAWSDEVGSRSPNALRKESIQKVSMKQEPVADHATPAQKKQKIMSSSSKTKVVVLTPNETPPSFNEVVNHVSLKHTCYHEKPYFSKPEDAAQEARNRQKMINKLSLKGMRFPPAPPALVPSRVHPSFEQGKTRNVPVLISPKLPPPTWLQVVKDVGQTRDKLDSGLGDEKGKSTHRSNLEKVDTGTLHVDKLRPSSLTSFRLMLVEVVCECAKDRPAPNPEIHRVVWIYAAVFANGGMISQANFLYRMEKMSNESETKILLDFTRFVRDEDPDAICGWEIQRSSFGYILARAKMLGLKTYSQSLSRVPNGFQDPRHMNDSYGEKSASEFWITGRIVLNLWRIVRKEINLSNYQFETVAQQLFGLPQPIYDSVTKYLDLYLNPAKHSLLLFYLKDVVSRIYDIVEHLDIVTKTGEYSKLLGIDFFSTITRGSQYKVEGVLIRVAKPMNYVFPSPGRDQVASQDALTQIALNADPKSNFYVDPMAVLDFRSLYPSVIIAYNLCFSTFVGQLLPSQKIRFETGVFAKHRNDRGGYPSKRHLQDLHRQKQLMITSDGIIFVKKTARRGVLPIMLDEILKARIRMKDAVKFCDQHGKNEWTRVFDARQYALKMLANVTYGYTAASFSGRMPFSSLADSIVLLGKQALEYSMSLAVQPNPTWRYLCPAKPKVVYGDSIVADTPILILNGMTNTIEVLTCEVLGHRYGVNQWTFFDNTESGKEYINLVPKTFSWTEQGWTKIERVIRHRCVKRIVRVITGSSIVDCTEDHSLVTAHGAPIRPTESKNIALLHSAPRFVRSKHKFGSVLSGFALDEDFAWILGMYFRYGSMREGEIVYSTTNRALVSVLERKFGPVQAGRNGEISLPNLSDKFMKQWQSMNYYSCNDEGYIEKMIHSSILSASSAIRQSFLHGVFTHENSDIMVEGKCASQCLITLLYLEGEAIVKVESLEANNKNNGNMYRVTRMAFTDDSRELDESQKVVSTVIMLSHEHEHKYVYDLTTENHHFQAGLGNMIVHNTDSMFVVFPNCKLESAFEAAKQLALESSAAHPYPMKLQMEKIYMPSFLVAKKRYVGFKYSSAQDRKPKIDSKGLENIRRDSCPIMQQIMNDMLWAIFNNRDMSHLKQIFTTYVERILSGQVSVKDFVFASKIRVPLDSYRYLPPSARVAKKLIEEKKMVRPIHKERIEYVITKGEIGTKRMADLVKPPTPHSKINAEYYIVHKLLKPLDRVFRLARVDVEAWYYEITARTKFRRYNQVRKPETFQSTILQHFEASSCFVCGVTIPTKQDLSIPPNRPDLTELEQDLQEYGVKVCQACFHRPQETILSTITKLQHQQARRIQIEQQCHACTEDLTLGSYCVNKSCSIFYLKDW